MLPLHDKPRIIERKNIYHPDEVTLRSNVENRNADLQEACGKLFVCTDDSVCVG